MNPLVKQFVNQKINHLTPKELVALGRQYGIHVTAADAQKLVAILKREKVDVFDDAQRKRILKTIAQEISPEIAKKLQALFNKFL